MKKVFLFFGLIALFLSSSLIFADGGEITFDEDKSIVNVKIDALDYTAYKVQVIKKDGEKNGTYNYNVFDDDEDFPLQMGSGTYTVRICKRIDGNRYSIVNSKTELLSLQKNQVYLQSVQNVNWDDKAKAIKLAKLLSLDKVKDKEKFMEIYSQIVKTIVYDDETAANLSSRYMPDIERTFIEKKGICYDYASIMASMLRSIGVPTKMVHGYTTINPDTYHAWNEVLLNNEWVVVDTTFDAGRFGYGQHYYYDKDKSIYLKSKEF